MPEKILLLLLLIFLTSPVHGMVYTWTDVGGVTHFTNKEYEIPVRYRARTKALYPEQVTDSNASQQAAQAMQSAPEAQQKAPPAPILQSKPVEPVIAPVQQKYPTDRATRRAKRSRERSPEGE